MLAAMPPSSSKPRNGGDPPIRDRAGDPVRTRARDRGDACPGALRLHRADDGGLARLRLPTGSLTPSQIEALADAADLLGDGHLGVTSRGEPRPARPGRGLRRRAGGAPVGGRPAALPGARARPEHGGVAAGGRGRAGARARARRGPAELDALLCAEAWATALGGASCSPWTTGGATWRGLGGDVTLLAEPEGRALVRIGGHARGGWRRPTPPAPRWRWPRRSWRSSAHRAQAPGGWPTSRRPAPPLPGAAAPETGRGRVPPRTRAPTGPQAPRTLRDLREATGASPAPRGRPAERTAPGRSPGGPPEPGVVAGGRAVSVTAPLGARQQQPVPGAPARREVRVTPWRGFVVTGLPDRAAAEARLAALEEAGFLTRADSPGSGQRLCGQAGMRQVAGRRPGGRPAAGARAVRRAAGALVGLRAPLRPSAGGVGGRPGHRRRHVRHHGPRQRRTEMSAQR